MSGGRVLALDLGRKRVGLAISDPDGVAVSPAGVLHYRGPARLAAEVARIVAERNVATVVVGLPRRTDGRPGAMEEFARRVAAVLAGRLDVPVELQDEFYTTSEGARYLSRGQRRRKGNLDMKAAQLLLVDYLRRAGADETADG